MKILDLSVLWYTFCLRNFSTLCMKMVGATEYLHKISSTVHMFESQKCYQPSTISTHCGSLSVAQIALRLTAAAAVASFIPLPSTVGLPAKFLGWVDNLLPRLDAQDLPLHQLVVQPPAVHQLTVRPLLSHSAPVYHNDVVCPLHCAEPMGNHQHRVLMHDVVQSLLNLQHTCRDEQNNH